VTTRKVIREKDLPQYIEAVEDPKNPKNPGIVVRLGLKVPGSGMEDPVEVMICGYQSGFRFQKWEVQPRQDIGQDSCVLLYWAETEMNPGETRVLGYTYGLADVAADGTLALSAPGIVPPGTEFVLTAYVHKAKKGTAYRVVLPRGLNLAKD